MKKSLLLFFLLICYPCFADTTGGNNVLVSDTESSRPDGLSAGTIVYSSDTERYSYWNGTDYKNFTDDNVLSTTLATYNPIVSSINWTAITNTPNTLSGYNITDAINNSDSRLTDSRTASDVYSWAKSATKPSYSYSEVGADVSGAAAAITLSGLGGVATNDSRLTDARSASDVYSWAKAATKPTYTNTEVGAAAASHNQTWSTITSTPTTLSGYGITDAINTTATAAKATQLATPRAINGVNFDGTAAITVPANATTLTGTSLPAAVVSSSLTSFGTAPNIGAATGTSLAATGAITSSGTAGIGYASGAGGTITQATSKSTGVTLNKICGTITMNATALANATTVAFTLTDSTIAAGDFVNVQHASVGTLGAYTFAVAPAAGSAVISVRNVHTASLSEAIVLRFVVIKAVTAKLWKAIQQMWG